MASPIQEWYAQNLPRVDIDMDPAEKERCQFIDRQLSSAESSRLPFLQQASVGIAQYNTESQWAEWDNQSRRMADRPAQAWQKRVTVNVTSGVVDVVAATLTNNQPGWEVTPATTEEDDLNAARACEKLLEHTYRDQSMSSKVVDWVKWAQLTGIGWLHVTWDPEGGEELEDEENEVEPIQGFGPDGSPMHEGMEGEAPEMEGQSPAVEGLGPDESRRHEGMEGEAVSLMPNGKPYGWELLEAEVEIPGKPEVERPRMSGAPSIEVVPPMSLVVDPGCHDKSLRDCRWIAHISFLHIDEIHERWPERAVYVAPDTSFGLDTYAMQILANVQGGPRSGTEMEQNPDRCKVVTYYERRSPRHPRGYYCIKTGDVILEEGHELPCGGRLPFVCVRFNAVPGRLWGQGVISRIEQLQRTLNYQRSKLLEMVGLHAGPKWAAEKGSVKRSTFTNQPHEVIEYEKTGRPPHVIPPPQISQEHRLIANECQTLIQEISGVSDISRGVVAFGISGRAAGIMQEADAAKRQPVVREMAEALETMGSIVLQLWRSYMPEEITIRVIGANDRMQATAFQRGSIRSTDVRISMSSMAVKSPTILREQIMQAAERGLLGDIQDPETRARLGRALAFPGLDDPNEGVDHEEGYAQEQVYAMMEGTPVPIEEWEDHATHIRVIRRAMQSSMARMIPPQAFATLKQALATRYAYLAATKGEGMPATAWWVQYADPAALALLQQPAQVPGQPAAPPAAPEQPAAPAPMDAFGMPPEMDKLAQANAAAQFVPGDPNAIPDPFTPLRNASPIPTGTQALGLPIGGSGIPSVSTGAALQSPESIGV